ncbi:unnamed protein product [Fraxinus pennsylvanica]|uniref:Uncharacterized protein n=1 Tax=Fraxinus pennsylvanica TaxID=56036 RepID=A0AAD1YYN7_9LAMI|nr:unnamed protein product [Fraxinus pennsylvanica]
MPMKLLASYLSVLLYIACIAGNHANPRLRIFKGIKNHRSEISIATPSILQEVESQTALKLFRVSKDRQMKLLIAPTGSSFGELCKVKYEPLWINGGGHCNLERYPEFIKHLKKFVLSLGKSKPPMDDSKTASLDSDNLNKSTASNTSDTLQSDLPDLSRNSLDSRIDNSKKLSKPEKSR